MKDFFLKVSVIVAGIPVTVLAQGTQGNLPPPPPPPVQSFDLSNLNPLGSTSLQDLLGKLVGNLIILAIPILSIMVIVGGFQLMTSAGNAEKATKGRKTLLYAVIGFAVIIISTSIAYILKNLLTT